ncbi:hypothetical protein [Amycolatopsis panacis]|uniref:Uncharacterized protein n=1 Tax=Amycolatopsis panacis TaxID=2340917 RepID=A0A419HYC9_9PSEU|nr:hypothetical protein [Amycolatopsis panacis]RJQ82176.1 hypothetical protein D5S19_22195 [Amycolatopsis panacis]
MQKNVRSQPPTGLIPEFDLAGLNIPDEATARRRLRELTRHNGAILTPAETYPAEDASAAIRLTVDRQAHLTQVEVALDWARRIPPERFAATVFRTYSTALQRAALLEAQRPRPAGPPEPARENSPDWSSLTLEQALERAQYEIEKRADRMDEVRRSAAPVRPAGERGFTSPQGSLHLRSRGGVATAMTGVPERIRQLSAAQLSCEIAALFEMSGPGFPDGGNDPSEGTPESDDDYFTGFRVDG